MQVAFQVINSFKVPIQPDINFGFHARSHLWPGRGGPRPLIYLETGPASDACCCSPPESFYRVYGPGQMTSIFCGINLNHRRFSSHKALDYWSVKTANHSRTKDFLCSQAGPASLSSHCRQPGLAPPCTQPGLASLSILWSVCSHHLTFQHPDLKLI